MMPAARLVQLMAGAGATLVGVALVEALLLAGARPLTPVGWPGLGLLLGAALGGIPAAIAGALILAAYYLANLGVPERFPAFYAGEFHTFAFLGVIALLAAIVLRVRPYVRALRASEHRLRVITDNLPALVAYIDAEQRYRFNNRVYEHWLGLAPAALAGRSVRALWGEAFYGEIQPILERALRGEAVSHQYTFTRDGVERHVLANYVPDPDPAGRVRGCFVLASDVTPLATAHVELREARARLDAALDGSGVSFWDADLRTGRVFLSEAWGDIVGLPAAESVQTVEELEALVHPDDLEEARRASLETMKGLRPSYALEHRVRTRAGDWKWVLSRGRVTERDPATQRALRMIGTNVDITERKRSEQALQSIALSDALTGLANRTLFTERLRHALARRARSGAQLAVLYLDIDHFKQVNDRHGHLVGDELLKAFGARLRTCVRAADTVARLGGDEFVVLLEDMRSADNAAQVAGKILERMRAPVVVEAHELVVTASIGIAHAGAGSTEASLLERADAALYEAKGAGRNAFRAAPHGA